MLEAFQRRRPFAKIHVQDGHDVCDAHAFEGDDGVEITQALREKIISILLDVEKWI